MVYQSLQSENQTSSDGYIEPAIVEEEEFHLPHTPYQAIRLLLWNATEYEKDDIVQKFFHPNIVAPSERPDTLSLPGLKGKGINFNEIPSYKDGFFHTNTFLHPEIKIEYWGMQGESYPYQLKTDLFVNLILLLCFFAITFLIANSPKALINQMKELLQSSKREQRFMLKSESDMRNVGIIVILVCFLLDVLFLNYTEERLSEVFHQLSPYIILGTNMVILTAYYFIKLIGYKIVNWTFFPKQKYSQWQNSLRLIILLRALFYFTILISSIYLNIGFYYVSISFIVAYILSEILLIIKSKQLFFHYKLSHFHLFLYFCTLEIIPTLVVWKILVTFSKYLIGYI